MFALVLPFIGPPWRRARHFAGHQQRAVSHKPRPMEALMESYKHIELGATATEWLEAPEFFTSRTRYVREHPAKFVIPPEGTV